MSDIRAASVRLCRDFLPETTKRADYVHWRQIGFDHIAKDYGQGAGTTCGFLPHFLLWRLGCRDNTLVNRSAPNEGLTYRIGENLSIFTKVKRQSWVRLESEADTRAVANGKGPKPGDACIIRGGYWKDPKTGERNRDSAHIFVLLEVKKADGKKVEWLVAQTGVSNDAMQQGGQITTLTAELKDGDTPEANGTHKGPNLIFVANILNEEPNFPRRLIGWNDLEQVGMGAKPKPAFTDLFQKRRLDAAENGPNKIMEWLGWWHVADPGGFVPLAPPFILLDRGHEAFRLSKINIGPHVCDTAGVWTRTGATLAIQWDNGTSQSWTIKRMFSPKVKTEGTPLSANTGTLTALPKAPDVLPMRWR
ncbi:hypothetical protein ACQW02_02735 [Humitalea sp. 24SJ18S-53]|uniref:hypothetical protein n=1 Tax=Humitalea sp. 24SJ18S-53 TaxID=3422307 RepID=UPI003D67112B